MANVLNRILVFFTRWAKRIIGVFSDVRDIIEQAIQQFAVFSLRKSTGARLRP